MHAKLQALIGFLIISITVSAAGIVGIVLPHNAVVLINGINADLVENAKITQEDLIPYNNNENYSDFTYVSNDYNNSDYVYHAYFEFYNVSNRNGYFDSAQTISYNYVPGKLVFDIRFKRDIIKSDTTDRNYVIFTQRKQYIYNPELSTLDPNTEIINFNYMWPYYVKYLGNGTEYGFQAYIAAHLIQLELDSLKTNHGYSDQELAYLTLNRNEAVSQGVLAETTYLPHDWLYYRPAYYDLDFDMATSYRILFNATYNGHDYSVLTGEPGATKFFLDLVRGLYYAPNELTVNVTQLLAAVYGIDTSLELEYAKSFAAYLEYLLGRPALNWLYDHKIAYVCKRTAMEWITGVPDPLLNNFKFPLVLNQSFTGYDLDTTMYYAEYTGGDNVTKVGKIFAIANIPYYEYSQSSDVIVQGNYAYVVEGNRGLKIVNITDPLFLAIGQYNRGGTTEAVAADGNYTLIVKGKNGFELLNVTDPQQIAGLKRLTSDDVGDCDMHDIKYITNAITGGKVFIIANGEYGLLALTENSGNLTQSPIAFNGLSGPALKISTYYPPAGQNGRIYVAEGTAGLEVVEYSADGTMEVKYQYNSTKFAELQNVINVKYENGYTYILDAINGLLIFQDVNGNLTLQSSYTMASGEPYFDNLYVDSATNRVYLTQGEKGLIVVDVANKNSPQLLASYDSTAGHKGIASGVFVGEDGYVYLADYTQGLVQLRYDSTQHKFTYINKDELHTYVECWDVVSREKPQSTEKPKYYYGQFNHWPIPDAKYANMFSDVFDSYQLYPRVEKGYRLQWSEFFMRPFVYSSLRDVALKHDLTVYVYNAEYQIPYLQLDQYDFYWMHAADYINMTFWHVGNWNEMYGTHFKSTDLLITHSFPGAVSDAYHMQNMWVEPITGAIMERIDRVQYNTYALVYTEYYSFLNESAFSSSGLPSYAQYHTWHHTSYGSAFIADMAKLFWQEEKYTGTTHLANELRERFLNRINKADASRTLGAFAALALITVGFVLTSVTLHKLSPPKKVYKKGKA